MDREERERPNDRERDPEETVPEEIATKSWETVANALNLQGRRIDEVERTIEEAAGGLHRSIAELETQAQQALQALEMRGQQAAQAMEAHLTQSIGGLSAGIEAAEGARRKAEQQAEQQAEDARADLLRETRRQDAYKQAWQSAPLTLRLKFVRELMPDNHPLQNVLKEAAALEELRRRGRDLETWLSNYPALFADAAQALLSKGDADASGSEEREAAPTDHLAAEALHEAQTALITTLNALGITWIAPSPGDAVLAEYEVVGEENSVQRAGCVARLQRRGFRVQGRAALPAQVLRAVAAPERPAVAAQERPAVAVQEWPAVAAPEWPAAEQDAQAPSGTETAQAEERATSIEPPKAADAHDLPDWLRRLSQRTFGCDLPAVAALAAQVVALNALSARLTSAPDEETARRLLTDILQPLLPLLGLRYADGLPDIPEAWGTVFMEVREPLLAWLAERIGVVVLAPARGERFDPHTMDALETRRTVHEKEDETVAKLERIGLLWRGRPLIRVQAVRYSTGGNP